MFEKLHIKITILAALISTAYCIIFSQPFTNSCFTIIVTIAVFYLISGFISINFKKYQDETQNKEDVTTNAGLENIEIIENVEVVSQDEEIQNNANDFLERLDDINTEAL